MLKWSIQNSDPEELQRRAREGQTQPNRVDQEVLDLILGQPTVAKMRDCLGRIERKNDEEGAVAALEELEFYVEDLDNANDLAKIGGIQALLSQLHPPSPAAPAVRDAVFGVFAACLQNNPKFAQAAFDLGVPAALLAELQPREAEAEAEAKLCAERKALYALSALLRASPAVGQQLLSSPEVLPTVLRLCSSPDLKLRRRTTFLLSSLAGGGTLSASAIATADGAKAILDAVSDADEDVRAAALQTLTALMPSAELKAALLNADGTARIRSALEAEIRRGPTVTSDAQQLKPILAWLTAA